MKKKEEKDVGREDFKGGKTELIMRDIQKGETDPAK